MLHKSKEKITFIVKPKSFTEATTARLKLNGEKVWVHAVAVVSALST